MTFSADDLDESNARQIEKIAGCSHADAVDIGECAFGCCEVLACPDCKENVFVGILT